MSEADAIAGRLGALRARIAAAAERAGRAPGEVRLVGVAKRQPASRVAAAVRAGLRDVGENYVQEAQRKIPEILDLLSPNPPSDVRWHGIGRLQRNKARDAARLFHWIHSLDREPLARELARHGRPDRPVQALVQVNLSGEPQKAGVAPDAVEALLAACAELPGLRVIGLMTIPAPAPDPEASRPAFARLRELRDACRERPGGAHLRELSMGMTADFEVAIEEGATAVRIGTALFGPREE